MITPLLLASILYSSESRTIAQGQGNTEGLARIEAFRNAVEQIVGSYIDSKTLVKNSTLLSDSILNFSNGYIKSYDIIDSKNENGIFKVKISATVESNKIEKRISGLGISASLVNTSNISAEIQTRTDLEKNKKSILNEIMQDYPQNAYDTRFSKMSLARLDGDIAHINIEFELSPNESTYSRINEFCKKVAISSTGKGALISSKPTRNAADDTIITVYFSTLEELKVGAYSNSATILVNDAFFMDKKYWPKFVIRAKDENGNILATTDEIESQDMAVFHSYDDYFAQCKPASEFEAFPSRNLFQYKKVAKPALPFAFVARTKDNSAFLVKNLNVVLNSEIKVNTEIVEKIKQIEIETK